MRDSKEKLSKNMLTEQSLICRTCQNHHHDGVSIIVPKNKPILKRLLACADVSIDVNDNLPKSICTDCVLRLEQSYAFKIQCEFTERQLLHERERFTLKNELGYSSTERRYFREKLPSLVELNGVFFEHDTNVDDLEHFLIEDRKSYTDNAKNSKVLDEFLMEKCLVYETSKKDTLEITNEYKLADNTPVEHKNNGDKFVTNMIDARSINGNVEETSDFKIDHLSSTATCNSSNNEELSSNHLNIMSEEIYEQTDEFSETLSIVNVPNKKYFKCDTCDQEFINFDIYNKHKKTHGKKRYQCDVCFKWFAKRYYLKNHRNIHTGINIFPCQRCSKTYSNQGNLDRHVRVTHFNVKNYACTVCDKSFSQSYILRQHSTVHLDGGLYECDICHKHFKSQDYLKLHKERHLPQNERKLISPRTQKLSIKFPASQPSKDVKHICPQCGKRSNSQHLHQAHMRIHTGEKPFACEVCDRKFAFQQSLRNHLLVHTGEKPFKCNDCGLSFRQRGHLRGHRLVHTGEKNHICKVCSKSFALRGNLTVHVRTHTGETPHHCKVCPKKFYESNGLKRHMRTHSRTPGKREKLKEHLHECDDRYGDDVSDRITSLHNKSAGFYTPNANNVQ